MKQKKKNKQINKNKFQKLLGAQSLSTPQQAELGVCGR